MLWKCILYGFGGTEQIKKRKEQMLQDVGKAQSRPSNIKAGETQIQSFNQTVNEYKRKHVRKYMLLAEHSSSPGYVTVSFSQFKAFEGTPPLMINELLFDTILSFAGVVCLWR